MTEPLRFPDQDICQAFAEQVSRSPEQVLVATDPEDWTFARLHSAVERLAGALRKRGLRPGDRVGLYCINSAEFMASYLAIVRCGAIVVPVNLLLNPKEIGFILGDAGVTGLIYHQAMSANVPAFRGDISKLSFAIGIGEPLDGDLDYDDLLREQSTPPLVAIDPATDPAAIIYTSGTTGHPKGAILTHRNLVSNTYSVRQALGLESAEDRLLVVLPMFHSFAATVGMLTPALHGLSLAPVPKFDPGLVSQVIAATDCTVFLGVPSMYGAALRLPDERVSDWAGVRFGVAGGAAMPVEIMRRFEERFGFAIHEGDGPTECSPVTCVNPIGGTRKAGSVGLPVPGVEIEIRDEQGAAVARGGIGEFCVRGPNVMPGYWHLPEETRESFFDDWFRTGDLGYMDEDGYLFMIDRRKDMIIVNGMNVYPRMVEEVLYTHPDIAEAAVVGEPHDSHGEIPVAHVVAREAAVLEGRAVRAWCRERLGPHQVPRKVIVRDSLPKNATGKILKRQLRLQGELERGIDARDA